MSVHRRNSEPERRPARIRVVRLLDLLNQANHRDELCAWLIFNARSGLFHLYWEVPSGYTVLIGTTQLGFGDGASTNSAATPTLPADGSPLPNVKFVRLDPMIAEQVLRQARQSSMFITHPVRGYRFLGGLVVPDDASLPPGVFDALPIYVELHLLNTATLSGWATVEISPSCVYVDDSVYREIRSQLESDPDIQNVPGSTIASATSVAAQLGTRNGALLDSVIDSSAQGRAGQASSPRRAQVATLPHVSDDVAIVAVEPLPSSTIAETHHEQQAKNSDPYNLRGRADAVYALYQLAENCSRNPAYRESTKASTRHEIAIEALAGIARGHPGLENVFRETRRKYAAALVDPARDPNRGLAKALRREWPPHDAQELLSQSDDRRQPFLSDTLVLVIHAAEQWLAWKSSAPEDGRSKIVALDELLASCGLAGAGERKTLFPIITFDGVKFQPAPKCDEPKKGRDQTSLARHALNQKASPSGRDGSSSRRRS